MAVRLVTFGFPLAALAAFVAPMAAGASESFELDRGFGYVVTGYDTVGEAPAAEAVRGCPGHVAGAPTVTATLADPAEPLSLFVVGEGATGILVAGPDGIHHCDTVDRYGIAHVRLQQALPGQYQVWPMVAGSGAAASGQIVLAEQPLGPRDIVSLTGLVVDPAVLPPLLSEQPLVPDAKPAAGRIAMPESGIAELAVTLAGGVPADEAGPECSGDITQTRPDVTLGLQTAEPLLAIAAAAQHADTTLVVVAPDGAVYCNDDAQNYDPAVVLGDAAPGAYAIWVGVRGEGVGSEALVRVGREAPAGVQASEPAPALEPEAEPASGRIALPAEGSAVIDVQMVVGDDSLLAGELFQDCSGTITPTRPDAIVSVPNAEAALWVQATAPDVDTTLVVVTPDGSVYCNDDYTGHDPAIGIADAVPGDYAVWVGIFAGGEGAAARLAAMREDPAGAAAVAPSDEMAGGPMVNPFAGQTLESAAQAFAILSEAMQLSEMLSFSRLEETGPNGLILHDVVLTDPSGVEQPLEIARIRLSDLDLAGLSANGAPETFHLVVEDIAYAALAESARASAVPMPAFDNAPPMSVELSLLPVGGDMTRRAMRFALKLDGLLVVGVGAQMVWPEGAGAMGPMAVDMLEGEFVEFEMHDTGFLRALFDEMAKESGQTREQAIAGTFEQLTFMLGPVPPGSGAQQFFDMLEARLNDIDRPGTMRARVTAGQPVAVESMLEALESETAGPGTLTIEMGYTPD